MRTHRLATILLAALSCFALPAAAGLCAENAGKFACTPTVALSDWTNTWCDDAAASLQRDAVKCQVRGGTYMGAPTYACSGGVPPATDPTGQEGEAVLFERAYHDAAGCSMGSGGGSSCSNWNCSCNNASYGATPTRISTVTDFSGTGGPPTCGTSWSETVVFQKNRSAGCPAGMYVTNEGGVTMCAKYTGSCPDCDGIVGNPIDVSNGEKRQRETDYASPAPGGLNFTRYYNSSGFFDMVSRDLVNEDYWRHTYSSRVYEYATNAYVQAAVVRPDGEVKIFKLDGTELHNNSAGGAFKLLRLTDGGGAFIGWKITTNAYDVEMYDTAGKLTSITTRAGFVTTLAYDSNARLQTVTDTYGRTLTLAYDTNGRLSTLTDLASRTYTYAYTNGRLDSVTYPGGTSRSYLYEKASLKFALTGIIDERGVRLATYDYDGAGRATLTEHFDSSNRFTVTGTNDSSSSSTMSTLDAFGTVRYLYFSTIDGVRKPTSITNKGSWTYTSGGDPLTFTDVRNTVTGYTYDATRHLETSRTEAQGTSLARTITTTWHSTYRLPATITEPSGVSGVNLVTTFTYDTAGNLTRKNLTAGSLQREWNYTVNSRGQVLTINGPRTDVTDVTTVTYYGDSDTCVGCRGQVATVTNAASQVTTYDTYDADGRPTQISDPNGVATTLTYTARGWLASRSTAGETTGYEYDNAGNLSKVTMPDGSWLAYSYDGDNGLIGIDDSLGNSVEYVLDVMGNRVQESYLDPTGAMRRALQREYDTLNRLHRDLGAQGQSTTYAYDGNSRLLYTVTDDYARVTATNTIDAVGRVTNVKDAANGNTVFTYDAKDHLLTVKDPKLSSAYPTTYTYNGLGDLTTQVSPDTGTTSFTYDAAGNVATQTDARSTATTYTYDTLNRVTAATVTDGTVTYEYDNLTTGGSYAKGRLTKVTDPSGNTTYVYDSLGRVTSKTQTVTATPSNKTFTTGYSFSSGRQSGITYPSGRAVTYGFNSQGQVTSVAIDGTTLLSGATYSPFGGVTGWTWANSEVMSRSYDLDGRVKTLTLGPSTASYPDVNQGFGYDVMNRLASANLAAGQTQSFTYDANSNRTNATINAASTTYTYPSTSHKLTSLSGATTRSFSYDNAGNTTSSAGITYVYDGRGRMKQAGTATYLVNGLGQRVRKAAASTIFFAYDEAGHLIGEYDSTGAAIQETVWLGDLPVAVVRPNTPSGFTAYYIWADHLGTPRQITDSTNQSRWEWAHNDPFGNNAPNENPAGAGTFTFNQRLPGQYYDAETGLNYNYFRDYDASLGRYIQSDPIGLRGGINTYAYVGDSPLIWNDPRGLVKWSGDFSGVSGMGGFGGSGYFFDLTSECKCGIKVRVRGFASAVGAGLGFADWSGSTGGTDFTDSNSCPNADTFNGLFMHANAGLGIGPFGGSCMALKVGGNLYRGGATAPLGCSKWGVGVDASVSSVIGASAVLDAKAEQCCSSK